MAIRSVIVFALLVLVASCARLAPPNDADQQTVTAAPPAVFRYGAPAVTSERQFGERAISPCQLVSSNDLGRLGLEPGSVQARAADVGPSCTWYATRDKDDPYLSLETTPGRNIFVDTYRARLFPIFIPTTVDGFPAAAEMSRLGDTACVVTVGVNNDEGLSAWWYARRPVTHATEPCSNATKALAAVIAHLPPR